MRTGTNDTLSTDGLPGSEDPRAFLLEGGNIRWDGDGLKGVIGGLTLTVRGGRETMARLECEGRAIHRGGGFWTCPTCPECGGTTGPDFDCCSEAYA